MINFFKGHPTLSLLPTKELAAAYNLVILDGGLHWEHDPHNRCPLEYGTDPGNLTVRQSLIGWSNGRYGRPGGDPDSVNLTAGSSYGAASILTACTSPQVTQRAFLVSPTYFLINYAFVDAGFAGKMEAVLETPGGEYEIDVESLDARLTELDAALGLPPVNTSDPEINVISDPSGRGPRKLYRYVMYLVPTFLNPGGLHYSLKTRRRLIEVARKHDLLLLLDDVYDFLQYTDEAPVLKLNHVDQDSLPAGWNYGNTVSNNTFSKIVAPGVRCGWHETPTPALARQLATTGANKSGGTPNQLSTFVIQHFIESGALDKTIARLLEVFSARAKALTEALHKHIPNCSVYGGTGGYFVWCKVPTTNLAHALKVLAEKHNVIIAEGFHFEVEGDPHNWGQSCARLCVAYLSTEEIEQGIELLGQVLRQECPEVYQ